TSYLSSRQNLGATDMDCKPSTSAAAGKTMDTFSSQLTPYTQRFDDLELILCPQSCSSWTESFLIGIFQKLSRAYGDDDVLDVSHFQKLYKLSDSDISELVQSADNFLTTNNGSSFPTVISKICGTTPPIRIYIKTVTEEGFHIPKEVDNPGATILTKITILDKTIYRLLIHKRETFSSEQSYVDDLLTRLENKGLEIQSYYENHVSHLTVSELKEFQSKMWHKLEQDSNNEPITTVIMNLIISLDNQALQESIKMLKILSQYESQGDFRDLVAARVSEHFSGIISKAVMDRSILLLHNLAKEKHNLAELREFCCTEIDRLENQGGQEDQLLWQRLTLKLIDFKPRLKHVIYQDKTRDKILSICDKLRHRDTIQTGVDQLLVISEIRDSQLSTSLKDSLSEHDLYTIIEILETQANRLVINSHPESGILKITATWLSLCNVVTIVNNYLQNSSNPKLHRVEVYVTKETHFNVDLPKKVFNGVNLIICTNTLSLIGNQITIDTSGKDGLVPTQEFQKLRPGRDGSPGADGNPGDNAGSVFIQCESAEAEVDFVLYIHAKGGNGSDGLHGQDGMPGTKGKNGVDGNPSTAKAPEWREVESGTPGERGMKGGDGGDGGLAGAGGKGGEITLKGLDNIRVICDSKDEKNGKDGIPGEAGRGGAGGDGGAVDGAEAWHFLKAPEPTMAIFRFGVGRKPILQLGELRLFKVFNVVSKVARIFGTSDGRLLGYDVEVKRSLQEIKAYQHGPGDKGKDGRKIKQKVQQSENIDKKVNLNLVNETWTAILKSEKQGETLDREALHKTIHQSRSQRGVLKTMQKKIKFANNYVGEYFNRAKSAVCTSRVANFFGAQTPEHNQLAQILPSSILHRDNDSDQILTEFWNLLTINQDETKLISMRSLLPHWCETLSYLSTNQDKHPSEFNQIKNYLLRPLLKKLASKSDDVNSKPDEAYQIHYVTSGRLCENVKFLLHHKPKTLKLVELLGENINKIVGRFSNIPHLFSLLTLCDKPCNLDIPIDSEDSLLHELTELTWDKKLFFQVFNKLFTTFRNDVSSTVIGCQKMINSLNNNDINLTRKEFYLLTRLDKGVETNLTLDKKTFLVVMAAKCVDLELKYTSGTTAENEMKAFYFPKNNSGNVYIGAGVEANRLNFILPFVTCSTEELQAVKDWAISNQELLSTKSCSSLIATTDTMYTAQTTQAFITTMHEFNMDPVFISKIVQLDENPLIQLNYIQKKEIYNDLISQFTTTNYDFYAITFSKILAQIGSEADEWEHITSEEEHISEPVPIINPMKLSFALMQCKTSLQSDPHFAHNFLETSQKYATIIKDLFASLETYVVNGQISLIHLSSCYNEIIMDYVTKVKTNKLQDLDKFQEKLSLGIDWFASSEIMMIGQPPISTLLPSHLHDEAILRQRIIEYFKFHLFALTPTFLEDTLTIFKVPQPMDSNLTRSISISSMDNYVYNMLRFELQPKCWDFLLKSLSGLEDNDDISAFMVKIQEFFATNVNQRDVRSVLDFVGVVISSLTLNFQFLNENYIVIPTTIQLLEICSTQLIIEWTRYSAQFGVMENSSTDNLKNLHKIVSDKGTQLLKRIYKFKQTINSSSELINFSLQRLENIVRLTIDGNAYEKMQFLKGHILIKVNNFGQRISKEFSNLKKFMKILLESWTIFKTSVSNEHQEQEVILLSKFHEKIWTFISTFDSHLTQTEDNYYIEEKVVSKFRALFDDLIPNLEHQNSYGNEVNKFFGTLELNRRHPTMNDFRKFNHVPNQLDQLRMGIRIIMNHFSLQDVVTSLPWELTDSWISAENPTPKLLSSLFANMKNQSPIETARKEVIILNLISKLDPRDARIFEFFEFIPKLDYRKTVLDRLLNWKPITALTLDDIINQIYLKNCNFWWDIFTQIYSSSLIAAYQNGKILEGIVSKFLEQTEPNVDLCNIKSFPEDEFLNLLQFILKRLILDPLTDQNFATVFPILSAILQCNHQDEKFINQLTLALNTTFTKEWVQVLLQVAYDSYLKRHGQQEGKYFSDNLTELIKCSKEENSLLLNILGQKVFEELQLDERNTLVTPPKQFNHIIISLTSYIKETSQENISLLGEDMIKTPITLWPEVIQKYVTMSKWKCDKETAKIITDLKNSYDPQFIENRLLPLFCKESLTSDESEVLRDLLSQDGSELILSEEGVGKATEKINTELKLRDGHRLPDSKRMESIRDGFKNENSTSEIDVETVFNMMDISVNNADIREKLLDNHKLLDMYNQVTAFRETCDSWNEQQIKNWIRENGFTSNAEPLPSITAKLTECVAVLYRGVELVLTCGSAPNHPMTLRPTQVLAILIYLEQTLNRGRSIIGEIPTGEGKSVVGAVIAVILSLAGLNTDVITSSAVLAKETLDQVAKLYELFEIRAAQICMGDVRNNTALRSACYQHCQVIYSDLATLHKDFLSSKGTTSILCGRTADRVIIDEVDSLLLDRAENVTYLGHTIPDMRYMNSLYIQIYLAVQRVLKKDEEFLTQEDKSAKVSSIINGQLSQGIIPMPKYMTEFVRLGLPTWISLAFQSLKLILNDKFVFAKRPLYRDKITVMDNSVGVEQPDLTWTHLHQFLQLCHGERLTQTMLKADFISNLGYFAQFENHLIGMTGTLGSHAERNLLQICYKLEFFSMPRSYRRKISIQTPILCDTRDSQLDEIIAEIKKCLENDGSILALCDTVLFTLELGSRVQAEFGWDESIRIVLYTSSYQEQLYQDELKCVERRRIIIASNIAARGTDVGISGQLREIGGLYLIMTNLPMSKRTRVQGEGRVARGKDPGSLRYILLKESEDSSPDMVTQFIRLVDQKNIEDATHLNTFRLHVLQKLLKEENLYEKYVSFRTQVNDELSQKYNQFPEFVDIQLEFLKNRWAFWLEEMDYKPNLTEKQVLEQFSKFETAICTTIRTASLMTIGLAQGPSELLRLANYYQNVRSEESYSQAMTCFQRIINEDGPIAEMALYYQATLLLQPNPDKLLTRRVALHLLKQSKALISQRVKDSWNQIKSMEHAQSLESQSGRGTYSKDDNLNKIRQEMEVWSRLERSVDCMIGFEVDWEYLKNATIAGAHLENNSLSPEDTKRLEQSVSQVFDKIRQEFRSDQICPFKPIRLNQKVCIDSEDCLVLKGSHKSLQLDEWPISLSYLHTDFTKSFAKYLRTPSPTNSCSTLSSLNLTGFFHTKDTLWNLMKLTIFESEQAVTVPIISINLESVQKFSTLRENLSSPRQKEIIPSLLKFLTENNGKVCSNTLFEKCQQYGFSRSEFGEIMPILGQVGYIEEISTRCAILKPTVFYNSESDSYLGIPTKLEKFRKILTPWFSTDLLLSQLDLADTVPLAEMELEIFLLEKNILKPERFQIPLGDNTEFQKRLKKCITRSVQLIGSEYFPGKENYANTLFLSILKSFGLLRTKGKLRLKMTPTITTLFEADWYRFAHTLVQFDSFGVTHVIKCNMTDSWWQNPRYIQAAVPAINLTAMGITFAVIGGGAAMGAGLLGFLVSVAVAKINNELALFSEQSYWHSDTWKDEERSKFYKNLLLEKSVFILIDFCFSGNSKSSQTTNSKRSLPFKVVSSLAPIMPVLWEVLALTGTIIDSDWIQEKVVGLAEKLIVSRFISKLFAGLEYSEVCEVVRCNVILTEVDVQECYDLAREDVLQSAEVKRTISAARHATERGFREAVDNLKAELPRFMSNYLTSLIEGESTGLLAESAHGFLESRLKYKLGAVIEQIDKVGIAILRRMKTLLHERASSRTPLDEIMDRNDGELARWRTSFKDSFVSFLKTPIIEILQSTTDSSILEDNSSTKNFRLSQQELTRNIYAELQKLNMGQENELDEDNNLNESEEIMTSDA
ncbi:Protein translocase subunit SecA 2, partial [Folsomia candida]